jgi:macrocin-O-methyltransferase TylF-like protien
MHSRKLRDIPRFILRARAMIWPDYFAKHIYPLVREHTLLRYEALRSLYQAAQYVVKQGIRGSAVECGVARGGSGAAIAAALNDADAARQVFLFDTFEGLPAPTRDDPDYERAIQFTGKCRGELEEVHNLFCRLGLRNHQLIKGMFQDTLPTTETGDISLLHIDGDWYESTRVCLENLWDRVPEGGVVQIDDYGEWQGCKRAVDEFLSERAIEVRLHYIDPSARKLVKLSKAARSLA